MHVADDVVHVLLEHRVTGVVGLLDLGDGLAHRIGRRQEGRLGAGHHDVADRAVAEGECTPHEDLLHLVDVPALLAGLQDHAELFFGVSQIALGRRLDAEQLQHSHRGDVQEPGDGPRGYVEPAERQRDGKRRGLRLADGQGLRHQLPEDDGDERHDDEGQDRGDGAVHMRVLKQMGEGHRAQPAQSQAGGGDAQLRSRQIRRQVGDDVVCHPGSPAAVGRKFRDAGVAHLDDGELGDDEERVDDDEYEDADYLKGGAAHRRMTRGSGSGGVRRLRGYAGMSISLFEG